MSENKVDKKPPEAVPKKKISTINIRGILNNEEYMTRLKPRISNAVGEASINNTLIREISDLFKRHAAKDSALERNLRALQKELESINEKYVPANPTYLAIDRNKSDKSEGGGRRRTKNAYFYNKRRKTKRRKGKK